ncbi:MAG: peptide chain release factor N(5)-glutamine methyltransferase [Chloroflexota bacterium]|nr:peptide chain release factor N(5)-glutamine methyltransferase [Chloroflexota bacterium]
MRLAGVESPQLDAQLLLAQALGADRSALLSRLPEPVPAEAEHIYHGLLRRRLDREPLAYISGVREFYGRTFEVTPDVLIPRPETELLVERALSEEAGAHAVAVDVGTGSGCIAITLALEAPGWEVYATDTSESALTLARSNARRHGVESRVSFLLGSLLEPVPRRADLVLANLPYVPSHDIEELQPEVRVWEPRAALDGGEDGLDLVRALLAQLPERTTPEGVCLLEIDPRQFPALEQATARLLPGWRFARWQDLSGRDRVAELRRRFTSSS